MLDDSSAILVSDTIANTSTHKTSLHKSIRCGERSVGQLTTTARKNV